MRSVLALSLAIVISASPGIARANDPEHAAIDLRAAQDPEARIAAAELLGASADVRFETVLAVALAADPDETVRAACARAIGRLAGPRASAVLGRAENDPSSVVQGAVAAALRAITPRATPGFCGGIYAAVWHPTADLQICSDGVYHWHPRPHGHTIRE